MHAAQEGGGKRENSQRSRGLRTRERREKEHYFFGLRPHLKTTRGTLLEAATRNCHGHVTRLSFLLLARFVRAISRYSGQHCDRNSSFGPNDSSLPCGIFSRGIALFPFH